MPIFRLREALCLIGTCAVPLAMAATAAGASTRQVTVRDAIESRRIFGADVPGEKFPLLSPNGRRLVIATLRGDLSANGNWLEIWTSEANSLRAVADLTLAARFFSKSLVRSTNPLRFPASFGDSPLRWLDDDRIALSWENDAGDMQIVEVDLRSRQTKWLTHDKGEVTAFHVTAGGDVLYSADSYEPTTHVVPNGRGFAAAGLGIKDLLRGQTEPREWRFHWKLLHLKTDRVTPLRLNGLGYDRAVPTVVTSSPDGTMALLSATADKIPESWTGYSDYLGYQVKSARADADSFESKYMRRLYLFNLKTMVGRPLWDAPLRATPQVLWSPDSRHVVLASAPLPAALYAKNEPWSERAVAVLNVQSGKSARIPLPSGGGAITAIAWVGDDLRVSTERSMFCFQGSALQWHLSVYGCRKARPQTLTVEIEQSLNRPPKVYALSGASKVLVMDLNPQLQEVDLGTASPVTWLDSSGREWTGILYVPNGQRPDGGYPLVIQTHGHPGAAHFTMSGFIYSSLGPSGSVYAARPLTSRGIAVLQIEDKDPPGVLSTPAEARMYQDTYEAAIRNLSSQGIITAEKVGIVGFSRTVWNVEYALVNSVFPYQAALIDDGIDAGYIQYTLFGGVDEYDRLNGAPPYGEGLQEWLKNSPPFNADRIRTPLRLQVSSGGIQSALDVWEMYSRLRQKKRPAEVFILPDIWGGSHALQNPGQVFASQEGAVDWFDFWLNGHEDGNPDKAEQYRHWRQLKSESQEHIERPLKSNNDGD